jgi:hypothetical protein
VVLDRCWWSAYAFGWGKRMARLTGMSQEEYLRFVQMPTRGTAPDVVFMFTHKYADATSKDAESRRVTENYVELMQLYPDVVELVPDAGVGEVTAFIAGRLATRGLITEG